MTAPAIDRQGCCRACGQSAEDHDNTVCPATRTPGFTKHGRRLRRQPDFVDVPFPGTDQWDTGGRSIAGPASTPTPAIAGRSPHHLKPERPSNDEHTADNRAVLQERKRPGHCATDGPVRHHRLRTASLENIAVEKITLTIPVRRPGRNEFSESSPTRPWRWTGSC